MFFISKHYKITKLKIMKELKIKKLHYILYITKIKIINIKKVIMNSEGVKYRTVIICLKLRKIHLRLIITFIHNNSDIKESKLEIQDLSTLSIHTSSS